MATKMIVLDLMFLLKKENLRIEDMMQQMMRKFDVTNEIVKQMRNELSCTCKKVDGHVVSMKHLEQLMNKSSTTMKPRRTEIVPSNTIRYPKNDGHGIVVTTREDKKTIDLHIPPTVEIYTRKNNEVLDVSKEDENETKKQDVVIEKVIPLPRPALPLLKD